MDTEESTLSDTSCHTGNANIEITSDVSPIKIKSTKSEPSVVLANPPALATTSQKTKYKKNSKGGIPRGSHKDIESQVTISPPIACVTVVVDLDCYDGDTMEHKVDSFIKSHMPSCS